MTSSLLTWLTRAGVAGMVAGAALGACVMLVAAVASSPEWELVPIAVAVAAVVGGIAGMLVGLCAGLAARVAHALHNEIAVRAMVGVVAALGAGATVSLVSGPGGHGAVAIVVMVAAAATGAILASLLVRPEP